MTESNGFIKPISKQPAKLAQHWITGYIPILPTEEPEACDQSNYEQGMPYMTVYTRRNNP